MLSDHHVLVRFGKLVPSEAQAVALMNLERFLRERGYAVEVFKESMADDSKLRSLMTPEQRSKL